MNRKLYISLLVVSILLLASPGATAQPPVPLVPQALLGTGFTFQGQLKNISGQAPSGCDMQFSLWDAAGSGVPPTGGAQIGLTQTLSVTVTDGLFTVVLNSGNEFGSGAFTGEARWLQVAVRCPKGSGSYSTLSPRQALTATPYALSLVPNATVNGLNDTGALSFGSTTRQMLNLWGTQYGIGVQSYDTYFRTDNGAGFAWYSGGAHSDGHYDPGSGGSTLMTLDANSGLKANNAGAGAYGVSGSGGMGGVYGKTSNSSGGGVYGYNDSSTYVNTGAGVVGSGLNTNGVVAISYYSNPIVALGSNLNDREFMVTNDGNVYADGAYNSPAADLAELLPATDGLEPGDVLVIGADGRLERSGQPYQTNVVGVHSTAPAFLGGRSDDASTDGRVPLAVIGVVPVKVTAEGGTIYPGDLLTTSSTPGHAMKANSQPPVGSVIGKALGTWKDGTGTIQMIVLLH